MSLAACMRNPSISTDEHRIFRIETRIIPMNSARETATHMAVDARRHPSARLHRPAVSIHPQAGTANSNPR
ncbi:MAG: hypothetical protein JWQ98_2381 [Chlorobi bacterium]|nr:hypothetical protein [Chlorobiota bacterium]